MQYQLFLLKAIFIGKGFHGTGAVPAVRSLGDRFLCDFKENGANKMKLTIVLVL
jgi:hypothetical protein